MDFDEKVKKILASAGKALEAVAVKAAAWKDYETAATIFAAAKRVADSMLPDGAAEEDVLREMARAMPPGSPPHRPKAKGRRLPRGGAGDKPRGNPVYKRTRDGIVRIAPTKYTASGRDTYVHRCRWVVVETLMSRAETAGALGPFAMRDVLPLRRENQDGETYPGYQAWVANAWLVSQGLLKRYGREHYFVCHPGETKKRANAAWIKLAVQPEAVVVRREEARLHINRREG